MDERRGVQEMKMQADNGERVVKAMNSMWITGMITAKREAKSPRPLRGLQVDFSLTRNVPYTVR